MQVNSFATNAVNSLPAEAQRSAYAKSAELSQQSVGQPPKVFEQARDERKKIEQANAAERDVANNADRAPTQDELNRALQQVNDAFMQKSQTLTATVERDKYTGIDVFKISDKLTKEVIMQLPPKAIVEMAKAMDQAAENKVQLINEKA